MKQIKKIGLALLLLLSVNGIKAQTVDEVIDKFIAAIGGREKMLALNSIKMDGTLTTQGFDVGITVTVLNGKGARTDISVPGMSEGYRIITPTKGWNFLPFQGMTGPEEASEDMVKAGQSQLDLQTSFLDYAKKGHKVELQGKEKVDGADCYKIKITYKNGKSTVVYIDAKTYYRVKAVATVDVNGTPTEVENTYSDFKKTPEGYVIPYSQTNQSGTIIYTSVEINKPVDEKIFVAN